MAKTLDAAFKQFYDSINLDGNYRDIANGRKDHIIELLDKGFNIVEAFPTGSIPRYTALHGYADLDIMVVFSDYDVKSKTPTQLLQDVRDVLGQYKTARKNGQAVTLHYKGWPNVDIVPVTRSLDSQGNVMHYNVPNANNDTWIFSKPKTHTKNIEAKSASDSCGPAFRRIIKMIKHWNRKHGKYLQSYHIEALAFKVLEGELNYMAWDIYQFFKQAKTLLLGPLYYNGGIADSYLTIFDRQEVIKRFDTAIEKSQLAWFFGHGGSDQNLQRAMNYWHQVFGEKFPAYG